MNRTMVSESVVLFVVEMQVATWNIGNVAEKPIRIIIPLTIVFLG